MAINNLKINHLHRLICIPVDDIHFSYTSNLSSKISLFDEHNHLIEEQNILPNHASFIRFHYQFLKNSTYKIVVQDEKDEESLVFETEPDFDAKFITPCDKNLFAPEFIKNFSLYKKIKKARLYITGLGLYQAFINEQKVGDQYLTPGFNDYCHYLRFQGYDVTSLLKENNKLEIHLGDGWYKGRIGLDKKPGQDDKVFGDTYALALKLVVTFDDDSEEIIYSDSSFVAKESETISNSIYDGEYDDYSKEKIKTSPVEYCDKTYNVLADFSAPIIQKDSLKPTLYLSPKGEKILDFHQNMVGFVRVNIPLKKGQKISLKHGEVLQKECFYNANLRSAKAEAIYVGNGEKNSYEPKFTFFGFRYVLVEGLDEVNPDDFEGIVIYSDLDKTISCSTSNEKINQLISNTFWGQRGNFIDVPTDCPQRDERMGWTADTQVFVNTACFNMDCLPFYKKYMMDLRVDQIHYYQNDIPMYSPSLKGEAGHGGAVWADAGVIIPWNLYMAYGDKKLLSDNYPMMKDYVETLITKDHQQGDRHLILFGFTFGDWLAQDGVCAQSLMGGTDNGFIMSTYYHYAVQLVKNAAKELQKDEDFALYSKLEEQIKQAIINEYFTATGRFALNTQCAYILALRHHLYVNKEALIQQFKERLSKDFYRMKTGFTGTPVLMNTLIENGLVEDAYRILFNEKCPGWLYCINLGATTIWERWNSLLEDGTISGINMNSLNHYAYGSVCEAIYSDIVGLKPIQPGFKEVEIAPHPNWRLKNAHLHYISVSGEFDVSWEILEETFVLKVTLPESIKALVLLPNEQKFEQTGGTMSYSMPCLENYHHPFNLDTPNIDIINHPNAKAALFKNCPQAYDMITGENEEFLTGNGRMISYLAMFGASKEQVEHYELDLKSIKV